MKTQSSLDALEQAIWSGKAPDNKKLVDHSDRRSQYPSIQIPSAWQRRTSVSRSELLATPMTVRGPSASSASSKLRSSTRSARGSHCATSNGRRCKGLYGVIAFTALQASHTDLYVEWCNNRSLLGPIGYITPAKAAETFYANLNTLDMFAWSSKKSPSSKPGAVHCLPPRRDLLWRPLMR